MKNVSACMDLTEAIEARFENAAALDDLERQAVADQRLDRENVLRRIAFYRSNFHITHLPPPSQIALEETR